MLTRPLAGGVQSQGVVDGCGEAWPRLKGRHGLECPGKRKGHGAFAATMTSRPGL